MEDRGQPQVLVPFEGLEPFETFETVSQWVLDSFRLPDRPARPRDLHFSLCPTLELQELSTILGTFYGFWKSKWDPHACLSSADRGRTPDPLLMLALFHPTGSSSCSYFPNFTVCTKYFPLWRSLYQNVFKHMFSRLTLLLSTLTTQGMQ